MSILINSLEKEMVLKNINKTEDLAEKIKINFGRKTRLKFKYDKDVAMATKIFKNASEIDSLIQKLRKRLSKG